MSKSRRLVPALLAFGTVFLAVPAQSHKGNDHSEGCHVDRRTGDYHCHTPKTRQPKVEVAVTYCFVDRFGSGDRRLATCGHTRDQCELLVIQRGGHCEQQTGIGFGVK